MRPRPPSDGFDDLGPAPPSIDPYAATAPFRPRRNRNTVMTILAGLAAMLILIAAATIAWFGPKAFAGWMGGDSATSPADAAGAPQARAPHAGHRQ